MGRDKGCLLVPALGDWVDDADPELVNWLWGEDIQSSCWDVPCLGYSAVSSGQRSAIRVRGG